MAQGEPQADLTERAPQHDECGETPLRKRIGEFRMDGDLPEWAAEQLDELAREQEAALHSEREAAAAEARRAVPPDAVAWCATLYRITEHHLAKTGDWADEDIAHLRSIIALLDALASPPPPIGGDPVNGPFEIELKIHLTDGTRQAIAAYSLPVGKYATKEQVQSAIDAALEETQTQLGPDWRPLTRHEFENAIISERYGGITPEFATKEKWDE